MNLDDPIVMEHSERIASARVGFSPFGSTDDGFSVDGEWIVRRTPTVTERLVPVSAVELTGRHMDSYGSLASLQDAFVEFVNKVPFYGATVACADDANLRAVFPRVTRRLVTYGLDHSEAHVLATDVELGAFGGRCVVHRRGADGIETLGRLELAVPGRHNLQNALAAVAVGERVGLDFERVAGALASFHGAERRFERHVATSRERAWLLRASLLRRHLRG